MSPPSTSSGLVEHRIELGIVELGLARPEVRNALNEATATALCERLQVLAQDPTVRCVILHGQGQAFCAGADLGEFDTGNQRLASERLATLFEPALNAMVAMDKPVIAAVSGAAAGIGVSYVLASDLVVMGKSAYLKLAFINIGLIPDGGACWHLAHRLGHARAFELTAMATPIDAAQCLSLGLANRVVNDGEELAEARQLAQELASRSPTALAATKHALREASQLSLPETMRLEGQLQDHCKSAPDFQERVQAFRQRR